jgi:hypothetical protein
MNQQQWEKLQFFKDNMGLSLYPVADLAGNLMGNMMALVGLQSQTELERCAQYIKGKIADFRKSVDGSVLLVQEEASAKIGKRRRAIYPSPVSRGVLIELAS